MKSTQTKIVSLRTDPKATEEDNAKYLNTVLYELQKDDPSTSVINKTNHNSYSLYSPFVFPLARQKLDDVIEDLESLGCRHIILNEYK